MSLLITHHCPDEEAQMAFGRLLAAEVGDDCLIFLQGDLGAGKTTMVRGFLRGRGYEGAVRSPTYTLIEPYPLDEGKVYHLDLYRLADGEELEYLGLRDMLGEQAVLLIEWPDRGDGWLPAPDLLLDIEHLTEGRNIRLSAESEKGKAIIDRIEGALSD